MNWERIKRSAENDAGYRLFRENQIHQRHHDPADTALEAFRIHVANEFPGKYQSTPEVDPIRWTVNGVS